MPKNNHSKRSQFLAKKFRKSRAKQKAQREQLRQIRDQIVAGYRKMVEAGHELSSFKLKREKVRLDRIAKSALKRLG